MNPKTVLPNEFLPLIQQPELPASNITDEAEDGAVLVYDRVKGRVVAVPDKDFAKALADKRIADEKAAKEAAKAKEEADAKAAELAGKAPEPPKEAIAMPGGVVKEVEIAEERSTSRKPAKKK